MWTIDTAVQTSATPRAAGGSFHDREIRPVKNFFALLVAALLAASSHLAVAQETLTPPMSGDAGDLPPDVDLGEDVGSGEPIEPIAESMIDGETFKAYDAMQLPAACPGLFESSGTWLRRGFWYAEGDYLLVNKSWDRKGLLFGFEGGQQTGGISTAPGTQFGSVGFGPVFSFNPLLIDGSKPGADGMARVTLGRFLFRDANNRDHSAQFTYYGGGQWKQNSSIEASTNNGIVVNDFIDRVNPSFDGAQSMGFGYDTGFDSVETNYSVKSRLGRDQMQLRPDGSWVRAANSSNTYGYLVGLRYVNLTELLTINAERNPDITTSEGGDYFVETDNDLFGGQLGFSIAHETARWSLGLNVKGGSFWNRMDLNSEFTAGPTTNVSRGETRSTEDNLSFVGEAQFLGKWHLRPNMSLRAGFEVLFVDSLALAPHQVNFIPGGYTPIADDGDIVCLGSSVGIEVYR
jgi:hypothetical protein